MRSCAGLVCTLLALVAAGSGEKAFTEEHQRIAARAPESHEVSVDWGQGLYEVGGDLTLGSGSVVVGYQYEQLASLSLALPVIDPSGTFQLTARALGQLSNWRTRLGLGWVVPGGYEVGTGVAWIADPVVLSFDTRWREVNGIGEWGTVLSATEVLNEAVSWSVSLLPSARLVETQSLWSLGLQVQWSWYGGDWSASSSTTSTRNWLSSELGAGWRHSW